MGRGFLFAVGLLFAAPAIEGHVYSEHGTITGFYPDSEDPNLIAVLEEMAPDVLPQGVMLYRIRGVQGGDEFSLVADDGQEPLFPGLGDECPPPQPPEDFDNGTPLEGAPVDRRVDRLVWDANRIRELDGPILCNNHPDFDVHFTAGPSRNGPGDEAGIVPGNGDAFVVLLFGDPNEGFTYSED